MSIWKRLFGRRADSTPAKGDAATEPLRTFVQASVPSRTLTMDGHHYDGVTTPSELANAVSNRTRVFFPLQYVAFGEIWRTILRALPPETDLQKVFNYERHLRLSCVKCQTSLTPIGLGMLIMSQSGMLLENQPNRSAACRQCGGGDAYLIFEPYGFRPPGVSIANYFVYASSEAAAAAFRLAAEQLRSRAPTLHGSLELRTDTVGIKEGTPYPHWVVLHFPDVQESAFNSFMESFADVRNSMKHDDWEILKSPARIAANTRNSRSLDSLSF